MQQVYSRRLELAREKAAGALEPVREAALEYYWELNAKVDALVGRRRVAQFAAISTRVDAASMHRALLSRGYPLLYPIIDTAVDYAYDVLAAEKCRPRVVWVNQKYIADAAGLTLQKIEEDIARLKEAEAAYEAEAAATYDFTPAAPQQQSQSTDPEPELAEQTA